MFKPVIVLVLILGGLVVILGSIQPGGWGIGTWSYLLGDVRINGATVGGAVAMLLGVLYLMSGGRRG